MTIASRTIAARLSAGCSGSRCCRAHTDGIGFFAAMARHCALLRLRTSVRIQRTAYRNDLRTPFASCVQCSQRRNSVRKPEGSPMETRNPRRWWILIVLCLSSLVLVVDSMALTVAVPSMTEDLGASAQDTQWILDSYILVFAGLLLTSGSLGDRFGRRKVMIIGLLLFGAASLAATFCTNPGEVIAVRVAMGSRRGADHALHAVDPDHRLRRRGTRQGDGGLELGVDARPGRQPGARRRADRPLLLALDLLRQRPGRRAGHRGGPAS